MCSSTDSNLINHFSQCSAVNLFLSLLSFLPSRSLETCCTSSANKEICVLCLCRIGLEERQREQKEGKWGRDTRKQTERRINEGGRWKKKTVLRFLVFFSWYCVHPLSRPCLFYDNIQHTPRVCMCVCVTLSVPGRPDAIQMCSYSGP